MCADLEHDWTLLLCINGDVGAGHPGVGAQVPEPHIGVSEDRRDKSLAADKDFSRLYFIREKNETSHSVLCYYFS